MLFALVPNLSACGQGDLDDLLQTRQAYADYREAYTNWDKVCGTSGSQISAIQAGVKLGQTDALDCALDQLELPLDPSNASKNKRVKASILAAQIYTLNNDTELLKYQLCEPEPFEDRDLWAIEAQLNLTNADVFGGLIEETPDNMLEIIFGFFACQPNEFSLADEAEN
ncbi:MAG: hypothetical protein AAF950_12050 [Pseudomonadota bacterium]